MAPSLPSIDLKLSTKLKDPVYRKKFFLAEASARIARQLIELRKLRGLNQKQLAMLASTGQPAISRAERADYRNWSFNTLRKLAEAMDARIRVVIEPTENVLGEYDTGDTVSAALIEAWAKNAQNQAMVPEPGPHLLSSQKPSAVSEPTLSEQKMVGIRMPIKSEVAKSQLIQRMGEGHGASRG